MTTVSHQTLAWLGQFVYTAFKTRNKLRLWSSHEPQPKWPKLFNCWICWIWVIGLNTNCIYNNREKECWSWFVYDTSIMYLMIFIINIYPTILNVLVHNDFVGYMLCSFMLYMCMCTFNVHLCSYFVCVSFIFTLSENDKIKLFNQSIIITFALYIPLSLGWGYYSSVH